MAGAQCKFVVWFS